MQTNLWYTINVGFNITDQILTKYLHLLDTGGERKWAYNETVQQLIVDAKESLMILLGGIIVLLYMDGINKINV
jgi:hypothetical protein